MKKQQLDKKISRLLAINELDLNAKCCIYSLEHRKLFELIPCATIGTYVRLTPGRKVYMVRSQNNLGSRLVRSFKLSESLVYIKARNRAKNLKKVNK